jgi:very-short-patch-repair endonuclease
MKLHYQKYLKSYAQKLRKSGNLSEVLLWNELKKDKLGYRFLRQRPIKKYIVDFYCSLLNLVIEIDGASTHDYKIDEDKIRQKNIESLGIKIIRFLDRDVRYNLDGVIDSIKLEILRLENEPPPLKRRNKKVNFI